MPGSASHGKNNIKDWVEAQDDIKTIVDIGAGGGTYPRLLGSGYTWIGIEIFEPYVDKFKLLDYYQEIVIGDVVDLFNMAKEPKGDLIIFGDVLEHIDKYAAKNLLRKALAKFKHVVVSIPMEDSYPGKEHYGNIHERHISTWSIKDIESLTKWEICEIVRGIGIFCR